MTKNKGRLVKQRVLQWTQRSRIKVASQEFWKSGGSWGCVNENTVHYPPVNGGIRSKTNSQEMEETYF